MVGQNLEQSDNDVLKKALGPKMVSCRICKGDHWTTKCPFKDSVKVADIDDAKGMQVPVYTSGINTYTQVMQLQHQIVTNLNLAVPQLLNIFPLV